jgi:hypothetical protein
LVPSGTYTKVHSCFERVINFAAEDIVISLCESSICAGPYRLILKGRIPLAKELKVTEKEVVINQEISLPYSQDNIWKIPSIHPHQNAQKTFLLCEKLLNFFIGEEKNNLLSLLFQPPSSQDEFLLQFRNCLINGINNLFQQKYTLFAQQIKRRGLGSTPAGDDFLTGYIICLSWLIANGRKDLIKQREEIYQTALDNDLLVNTFLHQAYYLRPDDDWANFLLALSENDEINLTKYINLIMNSGESSGKDMLSGFVFCLLFNWFWSAEIAKCRSCIFPDVLAALNVLSVNI